jgi:hypothetical protein
MNIQHMTLRNADLSYEVMKASPLCGKSSQRQYLNDMHCAIIFCHLAAGCQVELIRGLYWLRVVSGALGSYCGLKQIVINYAICVQ